MGFETILISMLLEHEKTVAELKLKVETDRNQ